MNVGIVLTVTPRITSDGYVTMDVTQSADNFVSYTSFNAPIVNKRDTQSTISIKDGNTVVLGGIIENSANNTTNKIPLLGDIPLIGELFRSATKQNEKTELLVFLTPKVVVRPSDADAIKDQTIAQATAADKGFGKTIRQMAPDAPGLAATTPGSAQQAQPAPEVRSEAPSDSAAAADQTP
jgi:general secretion pathway protein D